MLTNGTKTKKDLLIPYTWEERRPVFLDRIFYIPKVFDHSSEARSTGPTPEFLGIIACVYGDLQWEWAVDCWEGFS